MSGVGFKLTSAPAERSVRMRDSPHILMKRVSRYLFRFGLLIFVVSTARAGIAGGKEPVAKLAAGTGTIYLGSYAKKIAIIDEATEKLIQEIPLQTGLPWAVRMSPDRTRFYVQSADQERFEVVDLVNRKTLDTFTLSDGNKHVRALAFDVDAPGRFLVCVARTTTKLSDRFEVGPPTFIEYDLKDHKVVRTSPWTSDTEPHYYYLQLRFSPDAKLLYVFADEILLYDTATLRKVDSWNFALPTEPGLGRFDLGSMDEMYDEPGVFTGLFTVKDPVQNRKIFVVGRVNLGGKSIDFFPVAPAPERGDIGFAVSPDRTRAYVLREEIGRHDLWTVDIPGRKILSTLEFTGRPRMAIRSSSNGRIIYIYEAGNTIDLYDASNFKYLRTIALDADMMYGTMHVVPARAQPRGPSSPQ